MKQQHAKISLKTLHIAYYIVCGIKDISDSDIKRTRRAFEKEIARLAVERGETTK